MHHWPAAGTAAAEDPLPVQLADPARGIRSADSAAAVEHTGLPRCAMGADGLVAAAQPEAEDHCTEVMWKHCAAW